MVSFTNVSKSSKNFKEPFWHFEMVPNTVKQLVSEPHELFFIASFKVASHTNQLAGK